MKKLLKFIAVIMVVLFLIRGVFLLPVRGVGMAPTYNDGDVLLINKFDALLFHKQFSRGDVVVFRYERGQQNYSLLKRIVGLPSEKVEIRDDWVFIDGAELREDYCKGETSSNFSDVSVILTDDQYFVLGDNRPASLDSRRFGPIARSSIKAKIIRVLYHASK